MQTKLIIRSAVLIMAVLGCFETTWTQIVNPTNGSPALAGTSWQLVKIQSSDGQTLIPDDKSKYTIAFGHDGRVSARLDCNRGSSTWKSKEPGQVEFGPMALTRMMCPTGSLDTRIARDWTAIRSYIAKDRHIFFTLMADGGIYEFEPLEKTTDSEKTSRVTGTVSYRQRIALTPDAVVEVKLLDVSKAGARAVTIAEQTIKPAGRQVPIDFDLQYDPKLIKPRGRYTLRVRILEGGRLRFTNTQAYPVITGGHSSNVNVIVRPAKG